MTARLRSLQWTSVLPQELSYFYSFSDRLLTLILKSTLSVSVFWGKDRQQHIMILEKIDVQKDVDGFHPLNMGKTMLGLDSFVPATPLGVMRLLEAYKIDVSGKDCVIIGASNIVGKPLSALLLHSGASVSICHSLSKDVAFFTKNADLVFVGVGKAGLITQEMIKEGAIVIDIGINRIEGKIVGDVDFHSVAPKCEFITPVPGGVGPMTIVTLLQNTLKSARQNLKEIDENSL